MGSLNKVMLIGNLGKDTVMRQTTNGKSVCSFSLATKERYNGEEKVEWHNCVAWGKTAEVVDGYLKKGSSVYIEGKLQTRKWEKDGVTHYSTEVVVLNVQFLSSKRDAGGGESTHRERPAESQQDFGTPTTDDEIPF